MDVLSPAPFAEVVDDQRERGIGADSMEHSRRKKQKSDNSKLPLLLSFFLPFFLSFFLSFFPSFLLPSCRNPAAWDLCSRRSQILSLQHKDPTKCTG